ncbi:hypothetical protein ACFPIJ_36700 [Dactylosporangium cerinum]|uniref:Uncharacterized protein n=1 Tax=Dactylosporangium cerinum TaxID=1434730 RepID=A0ABV9W3Y7_9ACTN
MSVPALAEDIVLLALHPTETRDLHNHHGLRDTVRTSELVDQVLAGGPVPTYSAIMRTLRFSARKSLDPWLERLAAEGRIERIGKRGGWLSGPKHLVRDLAGRHAAQERLYAGFGPAPDPRSAALAVLVGVGNLMRWSARPGDHLQALLDAGTRVAAGQIPPVGLDPQILPHFARALEKSIFLESD